MEYGDFQLYFGFFVGCGEGGGIGLWIDFVSVVDDVDFFFGDFVQQWCEDFDEVGGVVGVWLFQVGVGYD